MRVPPTEFRQRAEVVRRAYAQVRQEYKHWLHPQCHFSSRSDTEWMLWVIYLDRKVQQEALNAGSDSILRGALDKAMERESWEFDPPLRLVYVNHTNMEDIEAAGGMMMFFR